MPEDVAMGFLEHLADLRRRVIRVAMVCLPLFIIFMVVELVPFDVSGITLAYPNINVFNPIAIQSFTRMKADLLPGFVQTTVMTPTDAIMVEFKIALFLTILFGMPIIVYQFGRFLAPALRPRERRLLVRYAIPAAILFALGAIFAYIVVLPFIYNFLYTIALNLVDNTFLNPSDFVDFTLLFLFGFGLAFELPIFMVGLTTLGVVDSGFWRRNWRFATVGIFIFGAVITPDGSGVTMLLVSLPMLGLYGLGYYLSVRGRSGGEKTRRS